MRGALLLLSAGLALAGCRSDASEPTAAARAWTEAVAAGDAASVEELGGEGWTQTRAVIDAVNDLGAGVETSGSLLGDGPDDGVRAVCVEFTGSEGSLRGGLLLRQEGGWKAWEFRMGMEGCEA